MVWKWLTDAILLRNPKVSSFCWSAATTGPPLLRSTVLHDGLEHSHSFAPATGVTYWVRPRMGIPQDSHFRGKNDGKPCGFGVLIVQRNRCEDRNMLEFWPWFWTVKCLHFWDKASNLQVPTIQIGKIGPDRCVQSWKKLSHPFAPRNSRILVDSHSKQQSQAPGVLDWEKTLGRKESATQIPFPSSVRRPLGNLGTV